MIALLGVIAPLVWEIIKFNDFQIPLAILHGLQGLS